MPNRKSTLRPEFTHSLEALVSDLSDPTLYPHSVEVITTIETHISVVFLTGDYAYKLKKPVDFGFLDFSTLEARHKYCLLEVELNRRTAPELYLGVVPIYWDAERKQVSMQANETSPVEYLVKMRQFDPNAVLGSQGDCIRISHQQLDSLALQIAKLHLNAESVDLNSELGTPEVILKPMTDNFIALEACFDLESHPYLQDLYQWTLEHHKEQTPLLIQRRAQGRIRACHGDLHLDNIALINQQPVLFDGIEFSDSFRWIDGISDLAFLLMDLASRRQAHLAWQILSIYLQRTQDYQGLQLLRFYMVYRAMVRSKITNLRAEQFRSGSSERARLCALADDYVTLAHDLSQIPCKPKLILLQGVSGSGKSHLAEQMLRLIDAVVINSDRTRKTLFGIEPLDRVTDEQKQRLYSQTMNRNTYRTLEENAQTSLQAGWHTIVDATFLKKEHRQRFYELAKTLQLPVYLIYIDTDLQQDSVFLAEQIRLRTEDDKNPSDADAAVMLQQSRYLQKPQDDEPCIWLNAQKLRQEFPQQQIKQFLNLPLTS
ncbi:bifunctional aminoglycoside phosphotransferase/ATP-binding protein [Thiomicrorhabdus sp. 6S3-12]|uniref:bifunctional aminoglycoside phosphotransferase/ATP-binding protein n=1 Tax=Thiomicrorhabdus sp. 6S3-12 TaxID=2819681 RepID=UPI001AACABDF|nr:bifunctional aminoglycoside phosphotransferase/ATP-binding protein [Thiomicrorhabdus sp. 6S3-12]MBO1925150.1 AAA family ATPase [Thiomicrorhabdus sp. 6S3-12]